MLPFTALPRNTVFIYGGWIFLQCKSEWVGVLEMCSGFSIKVLALWSWVGCCNTLQYQLWTFSLSQLNLDPDTQNSFALVVGTVYIRLLSFVLFQPATFIRTLVNNLCIRALWIAYISFLNSVISPWKSQKDEESLLGWWFRKANLLQPKHDLLPWAWTEAVPVFWYFTWLGFRTVCAPGRV